MIAAFWRQFQTGGEGLDRSAFVAAIFKLYFRASNHRFMAGFLVPGSLVWALASAGKQ